MSKIENEIEQYFEEKEIVELSLEKQNELKTHAEVSETANRVRDRFTNLLAHFLPAIAQVPRRAK